MLPQSCQAARSVSLARSRLMGDEYSTRDQQHLLLAAAAASGEGLRSIYLTLSPSPSCPRLFLGDKAVREDREKGRQFKTSFPKSGMAGARDNKALFDREHKWLFKKEKYVDNAGYRLSQPLDERKKGFGSSDAHRRDEFSNDCEVQKWRERLKGEMEYAQTIAKLQESTLSAEEKASIEELAKPPPKRWTHGPKYMFDVGEARDET